MIDSCGEAFHEYITEAMNVITNKVKADYITRKTGSLHNYRC